MFQNIKEIGNSLTDNKNIPFKVVYTLNYSSNSDTGQIYDFGLSY